MPDWMTMPTEQPLPSRRRARAVLRRLDPQRAALLDVLDPAPSACRFEDCAGEACLRCDLADVLDEMTLLRLQLDTVHDGATALMTPEQVARYRELMDRANAIKAALEPNTPRWEMI